MASTSYSAVERVSFIMLDTDSSDSGSTEKREDDIRAIGGPVVSGWWTRPVNSDTDNGNQEDDRCKLVFLLSFS